MGFPVGFRTDDWTKRPSRNIPRVSSGLSEQRLDQGASSGLPEQRLEQGLSRDIPGVSNGLPEKRLDQESFQAPSKGFPVRTQSNDWNDDRPETFHRPFN